MGFVLLIFFGVATVMGAYWSYPHLPTSDLHNKETKPYAVSMQIIGLFPEPAERDEANVFAMLEDSGKCRGYVAYVPLLAFVRITNLQDIPAQLTALAFQVIDFPNKKLTAATDVSYGALTFKSVLYTCPTKEGIKACYPFALDNPLIMDSLQKGPIKPHDWVNGWVLLDIPVSYDSLMGPRVYRISIKDVLGNTFSTMWGSLSDRTGENLNAERDLRILQFSRSTNLSKFKLVHLADGAYGPC